MTMYYQVIDMRNNTVVLSTPDSAYAHRVASKCFHYSVVRFSLPYTA